MNAVHCDNVTDARIHFTDLLDAAAAGRLATVRRDRFRAAVVDADQLRHFLARGTPSGAEVFAEAGGWSVILPGTPLGADGASFDEAINEAIDMLREYAVDWQNSLRLASNHRDNWGLVHLISLSSDDQLRDWLVGSGQ